MAARLPTILGISHSHDSGAVLIREGRIVAAVNEERLSRRKHDSSFPLRSLGWLLEQNGGDPGAIDMVAIAGTHLGSYPALNNDATNEDGTYRSAAKAAMALDSLPGGRRLFTAQPTLALYRGLQDLAGRGQLGELRRKLRALGISAPIRLYDHHDCHLAGAYYTSGRDDCLVISNDGFGDGLCAKVAVGRNGRLREISRNSFYNSLGVLYGFATNICGFPRVWHAGKTTGLAARGDWRATGAIFDEFLSWNEATGNYDNAIGIFGRGMGWLRQRLAGFSREDVAAGIQHLTETVLVAQLRWYRARTGMDHVALTGGLHANVRANQDLAAEPGLQSLYVFPNMGDGGLALGSALLAWREAAPGGLAPFTLDHLYLGPACTEADAHAALVTSGANFERPANLARRVAELLHDGRIIARCDGATEYGPRALGNRSILYRATDPAANDWLNHQLGRSEFMPFAPVLRDVDAPRLLADYTAATAYTAQFMTLTYTATAECRHQAPACVHVDGTMRPQVLRQETNPDYWDILTEYQAVSGHSALVNTSFNMHEEPIVSSPEDAIRAFRLGNLDFLILGPFLVSRS